MRRRAATPGADDTRSSWPVAAVEAAFSAAAVVATAWYSVTHLGGVADWLQSLAPTWRGLITLATMLLAGGLLALALARTEDAVRGWRRAHASGSGTDE